MKELVFAAVVMAMVASSGCSGEAPQEDAGDPAYGSATVTIKGHSFEAEVPLTVAGFYNGLMNRTKLDDNAAMLFPYPDSKDRSFWMKNTLIPLDMIFIDENLTIKSIHNAVPCTSDPCRIYRSGAPAKYVLEIRGNLTAEKNINAGDAVQIDFR